MKTVADKAGKASRGRTNYRPARANHSTAVPYDALPLALKRAELVEAGLAAAGAVAYEWYFDSDRLSWSSAWPTFAGQAGTAAPADGNSLWARINAEDRALRYEAMFGGDEGDEGDGVPFKAQYRLSQGKNAPGFEVVEDGRWYTDEVGRPHVARGVLRRAPISALPAAPTRKPNKRTPVPGTLFKITEAGEGFLSRHGLQAALGREVGQSVRHGGEAGFLLVGIDGLANVNHAYGFEVADQLIEAVWSRVREALPTPVVLASYTGNKLGAILPRGTSASLAEVAKSIIAAATTLPVGREATPIPVSLSIGGVALPDQANSAEMAMFRAEEALAAARETPHSSYSPYTPSGAREEARQRNLGMADRIVSALNDRRFHIAYQPVVAADSGKTAFFECLLRLTETDGTVTAAGAFMTAAEHLGLARLLDHRVLELVLETMMQRDDVNLSLNVSPLTVLSPDWIDCLKNAVRTRRDVAKRLIVEITETVAIEDMTATVQFVDTLHDIGARVAIDDFGAGYTSFRNLKLLNVDMVKIDGEFVRNISSSKDDQVFVRTLIDLAANFNLKTVAEHVETAKDADLLASWGVGAFQGYFHGRPDPVLPPPRSAKKTKASRR
ncbi:diguanylate cyclase/phosphodiesterase (GGDEF & EAL domains) with PAS/PAC sensor(s) [hydrothermal vent metagenome]|uniref:Diguanylate cyclase/phosphodiesterase (GGDEF & EAL domains) with PAS/PAC sensor(S) n=1 Tax=hydrothermal vent metagenome TaxID=652676 RepID=A0A3B0TS18_9ZZZZ